MAFVRRRSGASDVPALLVDAQGAPIEIATEFLAYVSLRGCSPNTVLAYAYDLAHLWRFFSASDLTWDRLTAERAPELLAFLRALRSSRRGVVAGPVLATSKGEPSPMPMLSPRTINRALAAISAFYDWAILCGRRDGINPIARVTERSIMMASDRHRPFLTGIAPRLPSAKALRVRTARRLPRPLDPGQITKLLQQLRSRRDLAIVRLMLDGGLRPGEVLGLHLTDIAYGRRRITVRCRDDHPRGVRSKSRTERIVDVHEAVTLEAVSAYVMHERPHETNSPILFLVGGRGARRADPLSYAALVRMFARACERAGFRAPWVTPHALRHTHATRMWEAGMRELTLQKRLGHASVEATRLYTRVSDASVVAEYRRAVGLDEEDVK
ncbi:tyrosine-type recombinase/integrase [Leptospira interrogans]